MRKSTLKKKLKHNFVKFLYDGDAIVHPTPTHCVFRSPVVSQQPID